MTDMEIAVTSGTSVCACCSAWEGTRGIHLGSSDVDVHRCKVYLCTSLFDVMSQLRKTRTIA